MLHAILALLGFKKKSPKQPQVSPAEVAKATTIPRRAGHPAAQAYSGQTQREYRRDDDILSNPLHPLNPMGVTSPVSPLNPLNSTGFNHREHDQVSTSSCDDSSSRSYSSDSSSSYSSSSSDSCSSSSSDSSSSSSSSSSSFD